GDWRRALEAWPAVDDGYLRRGRRLMANRDDGLIVVAPIPRRCRGLVGKLDDDVVVGHQRTLQGVGRSSSEHPSAGRLELGHDRGRVVEIPIAVDDLDVCDHIAGHDWLSLPVEPGVSLAAGVSA